MDSYSAAVIRELLSEPGPREDKYSRGVLGVFTGSDEYPGAAVLGVEAAARTGTGMIRYLGAARNLVLSRRPEVVTMPGRVNAWLVGSGISALAADSSIVTELAEFAGPMVLDAGALSAELLERLTGRRLLLTPHAGEAARLLSAERAAVEADRATAALTIASRWRATVLLKGARTVIATSERCQVLPLASGWLATAGSGDVLGGIAAGLAAQHPELPLESIAGAAAWLHDAAAREASGGAPAPALEIAEAISRVIKRLPE